MTEWYQGPAGYLQALCKLLVVLLDLLDGRGNIRPGELQGECNNVFSRLYQVLNHLGVDAKWGDITCLFSGLDSERNK